MNEHLTLRDLLTVVLYAVVLVGAMFAATVYTIALAPA